MGSNHWLPEVLLLVFSPQALYFVGDLSCSVLFTATIRFSLLHCCCTAPSIGQFLQWTALVRKLGVDKEWPKNDNTTKQWNATQNWSRKQLKQKAMKVPFWSLTKLRLPAVRKAESVRKGKRIQSQEDLTHRSSRISLRLSKKIESLWLVRWHMYCLQEIGGPEVHVKCWWYTALKNTVYS